MPVSLGASFSCFAAALGFFHASELALVAWHNGDNLSLDSALLQRPYLLAMAGGAAEFVLGAALFPGAKRSMVSHAFTAGATLVVFGEAVRKGAMAWAGRAFTHDIKTHRRDGHALVTSGPYAVCRHPGYGGWSLWAVGTQLMLGNPVGAVAFAEAARRFFAERIPYEERTLEHLFGDAWHEYKRRVPWSGVPFVR